MKRSCKDCGSSDTVLSHEYEAYLCPQCYSMRDYRRLKSGHKSGTVSMEMAEETIPTDEDVQEHVESLESLLHDLEEI